MSLFWYLVFSLGWLTLTTVAYLYGVHVGFRAGADYGTKKADLEWANQLEHGAL